MCFQLFSPEAIEFTYTMQAHPSRQWGKGGWCQPGHGPCRQVPWSRPPSRGPDRQLCCSQEPTTRQASAAALGAHTLWTPRGPVAPPLWWNQAAFHPGMSHSPILFCVPSLLPSLRWGKPRLCLEKHLLHYLALG